MQPTQVGLKGPQDASVARKGIGKPQDLGSRVTTALWHCSTAAKAGVIVDSLAAGHDDAHRCFPFRESCAYREPVGRSQPTLGVTGCIGHSRTAHEYVNRDRKMEGPICGS